MGVVGSDPDSSDADWSNNCTVSRAGPHKQSEYTRGIQRIVFCAGHFDTTESLTDIDDADLGPNSEAAVVAFQTNNGLDPDGIVGPETWAELRNQISFLNVRLDDNDAYGMVSTDVDCNNVVMFYQATDPVDFSPLGWTQADEPGSAETRYFGIGFP
ncbi:MAG: peptidoglycan-binding protein [Gammaproteobacteria bacterium]|nr:peptidoglycan-binding protein [Gammaproteobacteria bacterium]